MLQRIQTVWLVLAAVCCAVAAYFMYASGVGGMEPRASFRTITLVGLVAAGVDALAAVALYKLRDRQRQVILMGQFVLLLGIIAMIVGVGVNGVSETLAPATPAIWVEVALPLVAFVFLFMARKGVEADIKLLASVDRLR